MIGCYTDLSYINSSLDYKLKGHIGDNPKDLNITLYSDADFAGCFDTAKSTSGVFIALTDPNSFFPLNAISKKQSCVSHSTPEAEIVAADWLLERKVYLPYNCGTWC